MRIADFLIQQLKTAGVDTVYGLPGGENVEILDAIRRAGIDFVLVRNESSALYMADTAARLNDTIGVALTTLGPGITHAYAGLAHAFLDRAPVLLITAQTDSSRIGRHTHQVLDLQASVAPVTKFSAELSPANAISSIEHGLALLRAGRPGPVHLGISNRVAAFEVSTPPFIQPKPVVQRDLTAALQTVQARLAQAKRPVIIVGLGLEPDRPYAALARLAERFNAPLIDTPKSKGALPAEHPLFAGTLGLTGTDPVYDLLDESDCILAIGFDVVELVKPWDQPQPLIWLANWENEDPTVPAEAALVGDLNASIDALLELNQPERDPDWGKARIQTFRAVQHAKSVPNAAEGRIAPQTILNRLAAHFPENGILTTDVGSHKIFTALTWPARRPNRYFVSNGLSAMGFGLTAALAAAQQTGDPTFCITGDAGLAMVMGELALLTDQALPVTVLVMNDAALDLIRSAQHRRRRPTFQTEFTNPDFERIAQAYRLSYFAVRNGDELDAALLSSLAQGGPTLIDCWIDPTSYPTTLQRPG